MALKFTKMQAQGNDFVLLETLTQTPTLTPDVIKKLADRHYGVGCDQVLVIGRSTHPKADFNYDIFNADGSTAKQCGNGARCVGLFIHACQLSHKPEITLATFDHLTTVSIQDPTQIRAHIGVPNFDPASLPLLLPQAADYTITLERETVRFGALSLGNPHAIIEVLDVNTASVEKIGRALNQHPLFPEGVNVSFYQVLNRDAVKLRVFERGAGETLACGSGACATMAYLRRLNQIDATVQIHLPGGIVQVAWSGVPVEAVVLSGSAQIVFEGILL